MLNAPPGESIDIGSPGSLTPVSGQGFLFLCPKQAELQLLKNHAIVYS